ncbi:MAG: hypothetical protein QXH91_06750, partial [Candidatus Bathyarchaeia archaeon]
EELERIAIRHAQEAVVLDREGRKEQAISAYQKAIECPLKIVQTYPDHDLNRIYAQRADVYKTRIRVLQDVWVSGSSKQTSVNYEEPVTTQTNETNTFDDLMLKNPPNVKWNDIAG